MYKKFLRAIVLVLSFLFLNLSFNSLNIQAEESLPNEIYTNAGWVKKLDIGQLLTMAKIMLIVVK